VSRSRIMSNLPETATAPIIDRRTSEAHAVWAAERAGTQGDPYYSERLARFEPRVDDVLATAGDVTVSAAPCGVAVSSERARARFEVCGIGVREASAALEAIDGARTLAEARAAVAIDDESWRLFIESAFGTAVLAPLAVMFLERRVSGSEIVRYAGSPYEIVRSYWANMGDIAERVSDLRENPPTSEFIRQLRELNALALVGAAGTSFYLPASPVAGKRSVEPGELWTAAAVVEPRESGPFRFVSGPRVNASLIGGAHYHALIAHALGDPEAAKPSRDFVDPSGLRWGRIVVARADHDDEARAWFCPPRPIDVAHFDALRAAFSDALGAAAGHDAEATLRSLALFHQRFVRLHPFRAANQCVAMSLVNHVLRRSHGAGIPHLVLDHLALRFSSDAYARAFASAVDGWLIAGKSPVERYMELIARKERCFAFLRELGNATDLDGARSLVAARSGDAQLALVDAARARQ
jgi:hypothetical protein